MTVRTRMAPSPTGPLHIGTAQMSLFNFLLARKNNGKFILRTDDTDQNRNVKGAEQNLMKGLHWLGIQWDEGSDIGGPFSPYRQSERTAIYQKYTNKLLNSGHAYRCFCTKEEIEHEKKQSQVNKEPVYRYSGKCKTLSSKEIQQKLKKQIPYTIKMRTDFTNQIIINDQIRGEIKIPATEIGDFIIVRSNGSPILILTSTVDDIEMKITHAMRGEDMLNITFRMYFIYKALNKPLPKYAHSPFLYAINGKKLSKRHGSTSITEFKQQGYLPQAILNYLFFVGYTPANDQKPFYTLKEMIADFDFSHFQKGMPKFDYKKLDWYNQQYIKKLTDQELASKLKPFAPSSASSKTIEQLAPLVKERLTTLSEFSNLINFIFTKTQPPKSGWKKLASEHLQTALQIIENTTDANWNTKYLTTKFLSAIKTNNWQTSHFFMNLRLAVANQKITPPITECLIIMGKQKTINRISTSLRTIEISP